MQVRITSVAGCFASTKTLNYTVPPGGPAPLLGDAFWDPPGSALGFLAACLGSMVEPLVAVLPWLHTVQHTKRRGNSFVLDLSVPELAVVKPTDVPVERILQVKRRLPVEKDFLDATGSCPLWLLVLAKPRNPVVDR